MRVVRIIAKPEDLDEPPLYLDASIDDADMIVGRQALFGLQRDFNTPEVHSYPFVLHLNGRMNFGRGYERIVTGWLGPARGSGSAAARLVVVDVDDHRVERI